jgi:hypothetical protein
MEDVLAAESFCIKLQFDYTRQLSILELMLEKNNHATNLTMVYLLGASAE